MNMPAYGRFLVSEHTTILISNFDQVQHFNSSKAKANCLHWAHIWAAVRFSKVQTPYDESLPANKWCRSEIDAPENESATGDGDVNDASCDQTELWTWDTGKL